MLKSHCRKSTWIWEVLLWWFLEHRIGIALLHFRSVVELNRAVNNEAVEWMLVFLGDCAPWGWELAPISFFVHLCMFSADRYSAKLYLLSTQWQLFHPFFSTKKKNPWIHQGHPVPCHDGPAAKKKKNLHPEWHIPHFWLIGIGMTMRSHSFQRAGRETHKEELWKGFHTRQEKGTGKLCLCSYFCLLSCGNRFEGRLPSWNCDVISMG